MKFELEKSAGGARFFRFLFVMAVRVLVLK